MAKPYDLSTPRAGKDGKTYWTKIGTMWPMERGGFSITFDALPIPTVNKEGKVEVRAVAFPPKETQGGGGETRPLVSDLDDNIPFATPWGDR